MDAQRCVEVNPSWAKGYSRMGTALFRLGRHDKAAAAYSKGKFRASFFVSATCFFFTLRLYYLSSARLPRIPRVTCRRLFCGGCWFAQQFASREAVG